MQNKKVKIGELNFEAGKPESEEEVATLEIENDASMVYVSVDKNKARELKELLEWYLRE